MKPRFYFDTSVFGGVYDEEFSESSIKLFDKVNRGQIICLYSNLVRQELRYAPNRVISFIEKISREFLEEIDVTEIKELATMYIAEKVVGRTHFDDCIHIAAATIAKANMLTSWNFKHIVNVSRIRGYNSVNLKQGYSTLEICSPKQHIEYEGKGQKE